MDFARMPETPRHQGVTELMGQDAAEDDSYQGQATAIVGGPMGGILGVPDEKRQQEKGPVDAKFNAENAAYRNGPASHGKSAAFFRYSILYSLDNRLEPGVAISPNPR